MPRERVLDHLATLAAATDLPLNADFENGFALDAAGVAESVKLAVATGIAACRSKTRPDRCKRHRPPGRCSSSTPRWSGFAPRGGPSTSRAATCCSSAELNPFWWASRTST